MTYDPSLAERVRSVLVGQPVVTEKKMFGGLSFMLNGNMCCGVIGDDLMVRVGPDRYDEALARPHSRTMDFTGRPLKGMLYVGREGFETDEALKAWVGLAVSFAGSLPQGGSRRRTPRKADS